MPVATTIFAGVVIIRYRRCRIGYGSASRITEAKTDGRKETTDGGGHGGDERAVGRKWQCGPLPSETERRWRTRPDPFDGVWEEEILPLLRGEAAGRLRATTIIHPPAGSAPPSTLPITGLASAHGPDEVYELAGRRSSTSLTARVTIGGRRYRHLLFQLVFIQGGATAGETFVALKQGQNALWDPPGHTLQLGPHP